MLEIRKGTATRNYENTFFREFAKNLCDFFDKYSFEGLLIANSECEFDRRLQIDALLITKNAVCIIDFKNFGGRISLPNGNRSDFEFGRWTNEKGEIVKGGSSINPFIQLKNQKERFIRVIENQIIKNLPSTDYFNPYHTIKAVCFQKSIELIGRIPSKDELNFFILDKDNYLEKIRDLIDITDEKVSISQASFDIFKKIFRADKYDIKEVYAEKGSFESYSNSLNYEDLYSDQVAALSEVESFIKSDDESFFVLQGTSLSGKSHLIPFIEDIAFNNQIPEVKFFVSSKLVSNNLLKYAGLEFNSIYSYIYGGNTKNEKGTNDKLEIEIVPLRQSDDDNKAIFIVDESHLVSDDFYESINLRFGSGRLLKDFIKYTDLKNTKRKIIFVGDSFQLSYGGKGESALNPDYLAERYKHKSKAFQLIDKEEKSAIVEQALQMVNGIRTSTFNNLFFEPNNSLSILVKDELESKISESMISNMNSHILCYTKAIAQKLNVRIKESILKNGADLQPNDLILFNNNIRVEDENELFGGVKNIYNGQFGYVINVSKPILISNKLPTSLTFRDLTIKLIEYNQILKVRSFENYRMSEKEELSSEEILSLKILLYNLAEEKLDDFKNKKYQGDDELNDLLLRLEKGEKVKTQINSKIQKILSNNPETEYFKYKNSAYLRFGWAITVHRAMAFKFDEIFFDLNREGKTNEDYFRWVYTGLIRAQKKVNLFNYKPISPFYKIEINSSTTSKSNDKNLFYVADTSLNLTNNNQEIIHMYSFPETENISSLLQLYHFIYNKIENSGLKIHSIIHSNYQERYEIKGSESEMAIVSVHYNQKGQFKNLALLKSQPNEFGEELLNILKSNNEITDFYFIQDSWRVLAYKLLKKELGKKEISIGYIVQTAYKDTVQLIQNNNVIVVDMYYNRDGFFTRAYAKSCSEPKMWNDFKNTINELKGV